MSRAGQSHSRTHGVVVVTGASAGVGRATVRAFARQGASIGLLARGEDGLAAAQREVEKLGGRGLVIPTDVSKPDEVERVGRTAHVSGSGAK